MYAALYQEAGEISHSEFKTRKWDRRTVPLAAELVYSERGIRNIRSEKCTLKDISEGGAGIWVGEASKVPDNFYVELGRGSVKTSCYVVNRCGGLVNVKFGREIPTREIDRLVREHARPCTDPVPLRR